MSVSIKVSVRCRPFAVDDELGVYMTQTGEEEGEINLLRSKYTSTRFGFTYSWWSAAYGYENRIKSDKQEASSMKLIDQCEVYEQCGRKIKADLLCGNAVVLFSYGLSGSGKTFTVFGPDAPDLPEAWYKQKEPHPLWGIFPRLAYETFLERKDDWKITLKYFQNVVDTVRDLMSPTGKESHYKSGMKKDLDGFMDINWCTSRVLSSWDDLRSAFAAANSRKAIAPMQFNHQSTRGPCIMVLEVEMPHPSQPGIKQKGRVYVCDLAGTEPAGDIEHSNYERKVKDGGEVEYICKGPTTDLRKTKELQDQGKKINLSLSEMAQFFNKMAQADRAKTLRPGATIPGCNSYFLCKFLKDTMLHARTYLCCAIRPEVKYQRYTFATLGFAKNASVLKLLPKKATANATDKEKKLMQELQHMKAPVDQLRSQTSDAEGVNEQIASLQNMLEAKQIELRDCLTTEANYKSAQSDTLEQQRLEYGRRGINLAHFEPETRQPYFINIDEDPFRSRRYLYVLSRPSTVFGPKGDIQPLSLSVVRRHCEIVLKLQESGNDAVVGTIELVAGKGETFHNGVKMKKGQRVVLKPYDRVALGGELLLFRHPTDPDYVSGTEPTAEEAVAEYQEALSSDSGRRRSAEVTALEQQLLQLQMAAMKQQGNNSGHERNVRVGGRRTEVVTDDKMKEIMRLVSLDIQTLAPVVGEIQRICKIFSRNSLLFDISLQTPENDWYGLKANVEVKETKSGITSYLDLFDFDKCYTILKMEVANLRAAFESNRLYQVPPEHDPLELLFNVTYHLGSSVIFTEPLLYLMDTEGQEERYTKLKSARAPHGTLGHLEAVWTHLVGPNEEESDQPNTVENDDWPPNIESPEELLGKTWTYRFDIIGISDLPIACRLAYCQYDFLGETYTTDTVEPTSNDVKFAWSITHYVPCVTQEVVDELSQPMRVTVYIQPQGPQPEAPLSTEIEEIAYNVAALTTSTPKMLPKKSVASEPLVSSGIASDGETVKCEKCEELQFENDMLKEQLALALAELKVCGKNMPSITRESLKIAKETALVLSVADEEQAGG